MIYFEFYKTTQKELLRRGIRGAMEENNYLKIKVPRSELHNTYKRAKGLRFLYYDEKYDRSSTYRQTFFKYNPPTDKRFFGKRKEYWRCRYCNWKLKKKEIEVDHLIPVYAAKRSQYWQKKLPNGVNDKSNLVASCRICNRKKSAKTGLWYIRGKLGKYKLYWLVIYIVFIIFCTFIYFNCIQYF